MHLQDSVKDRSFHTLRGHDRRTGTGIGLMREHGAVGRVLLAQVGVLRRSDPGTYDIHLVSQSRLLADALPHPLDPSRFVAGHHMGANRLAPRRQLTQRGDLHVAEHGHRHRARDRGRRHHQDVRCRAGLGTKGVALLDAESMLLVNDYKTQLGELHMLLDEGMCADHDAGLTTGGEEQIGSSLGGGLAPGQDGNPRGGVRTREHPPLAQAPQHRGDRSVVLLRQDLGRGQQRRLATGVDDGQHAQQGHDGLARSDLSLQQPMHRHGTCQVLTQITEHVPLALGQRKR